MFSWKKNSSNESDTSAHFNNSIFYATAFAAPLSRTEQLFSQYASVVVEGKQCMTLDDFFKSWGVMEEDKHSIMTANKLKRLFDMADINKSGLIDLDEYRIFDELVSKPDAEYAIAWRVFDNERKGWISKDQFTKVMEALTGLKFDCECDPVNLFFGNRADAKLSYGEFTQLMKSLESERVKHEWHALDCEGTGYVSADQFAQIIGTVRGYGRIPEYIRSSASRYASSRGGHVNFAECVAFLTFINELSFIETAVRNATSKIGHGITKEAFMSVARASSDTVAITPLETDIIFNLFSKRMPSGELILDTDSFNKLIEQHRQPVILPGASAALKQSSSTSPLKLLLDSAINFGLGAIAGGIGATAVYPIDLVKTRMQNQRVLKQGGGPVMYKHSLDCFVKVLRHEGFLGLYRGLGPQLVGVAPEKAIKLTVNDLLRTMFTDKSKGEIYLPLEILAGGGAGASQVIFTNPLEIVKIRLQTQGGLEPHMRSSALKIVRDLGFTGLYKGAGACLLRDIPFSAIYFPTYAKMKKMLTDKNGKLGPTELFTAGLVAGVPAAGLVTPADVIKTRLQVQARKGETTYSGIMDCFWKVLRQEGWTAFWKGTLARVFRSSPQFGVTLLSYEILQQHLAPNITPRPPTNIPITPQDFEALRRGRLQHQVALIQQKWGDILSTPPAQ